MELSDLGGEDHKHVKPNTTGESPPLLRVLVRLFSIPGERSPY
jgi:hypothetical protein